MDYSIFHCNPFHISHSISLSYASSKLASIFLIIHILYPSGLYMSLLHAQLHVYTRSWGSSYLNLLYQVLFRVANIIFSMFHSLGFFNSPPRDDDTSCLKSRTESHSRTNNIFSFSIWDELCFKSFRVRS